MLIRDLLSKASLESYPLFYFAIYTAVLCAVFFHTLATQPLGLDEVYSFLQVTDRTFTRLLASFESGTNLFPYPYFVGLWAIDQLSPLTPFTLRLPSLVFAILAVFVFHSVLRSSFGNVIAFVACIGSLFVAPDFLRYCCEARPYSLYVLMAAITLYACTAMLRTGGEDWRPILLNGVAAFGLPSTHYVGIFYSVSAAVAFLLVKYGTNSTHFSTRAILSFVVGWILSGAVLLAHTVQLRGRVMTTDPTWIPVPKLESFLETFLNALQMPPVVVLVLLVWLATVILKNMSEPQRRIEAAEKPPLTFLVLTSLFWLLLPLIFTVLAIVGLPNLSLPRYFLPSVLGAGTMIGFLLYMLERAYQPDPMPRKVLSVVTVLIGIAFLVDRVWVPAHSALAHPGSVANLAIVGHGRPIVSNNQHAYFPYLFYNLYRSEGGTLLLIRGTKQEIESWKKLSPSVSAIDIGSLQKLDDFDYLYRKCAPTSKRCLPEFDIHAWAHDHGYNVKRKGRARGITIYHVSRH